MVALFVVVGTAGAAEAEGALLDVVVVVVGVLEVVVVGVTGGGVGAATAPVLVVIGGSWGTRDHGDSLTVGESVALGEGRSLIPRNVVVGHET